ncbi:MAG: MGMT family protein [Chloroflexi bacterium]|nr:MGMT family protein [Chloroflexota bacterium]
MTLSYLVTETSAGPLFVAYRERQICMSMLASDAEHFRSECHRRLGDRPDAADDSILRRKVDARLLGDHPLDFDLSPYTDFQRSVLQAVAAIPRGQVRSYGDVAAEVDHPGAARAVGEVMRTNPIPVLIPCHRVVRAGGAPGNYSPRPEIKRQFLIEEGALPG